MMSTLKKLVKKFAVVGLIAISCCSCSESDSNVNDVFEKTTGSEITYEIAGIPNVISGAGIFKLEENVITTTTSILEETQTTEHVTTTTTQSVSTSQTSPIAQTTQTTHISQVIENTETTSITTTEKSPKNVMFVTSQVEEDSNSRIFWQDGFQYYMVQPDDSWTSIAEYLEVDKTQLAAANDRTLDDIVFSGEGLFIPNEYIDYTQQNSAVSQNNVQPQEQKQNNSGQFIGSSIVYSAPDNASWTNICQAVADINGLTLAPGEYFSWNSYVGWKTAQDVNSETGINDWGYVEAPVIDGTEPGGGICVVSTALNKTARACGINTIKCPHSRPVTYASGDDEAAVDYSSKDLQFSNPYDYSIVFYATCSYGSVSINCYVA